MASDTLYRSHKFPFFDTHHWADWVELCCIANLDGEVDVATVTDRLREETDINNNDEGIVIEDESEELVAQAEWAITPDKYNLRVAEWFVALANREQLLGKRYPFNLNAAKTKVKLRAKLTNVQRLYLALLMMSNLHYFRKIENILTSNFEVICKAVFRALLPSDAKVFRFGKGSNSKDRYKGHVWDKLKLLSQDLSCDIKCEKKDFAPNDTGDSGLDLVGWVPWLDSAPGRLLLFGQCACSPKWARKQDEASYDRWSNKLDFVTRSLTVVLIPFFLRTPTGDWHRRTDFSGHLIVDRLRLLTTIGAKASSFSNLPAFKHVANCLASKESAS